MLLLAFWSVLAAAPALVSGKALANAVDRGFLARDPAAAALWLGVFTAAAVTGAWATRRTYPCLADIVEPMRDSLLRSVVTGTLRRAAHRDAPRTNAAAAAVAQITRQVEAVRDAASGQLMIACQFALTAFAVIAGTTALAPAAAPLIALPLALSLCLFAALLPTMIRRQRTAYLAEEQLARTSVDTLDALRDLVSCGAQRQGTAAAHQAILTQAAAMRLLAWAATLRRLIVALGAHVPIVLVLVTAPMLVRRGATAGDIVGVLTYLVGVLEPALRLLVQGVGGSFLRLSIAAERLGEASRPPADPPAGERTELPTQYSTEQQCPTGQRLQLQRLQLRHVTFAYGPDAEPIVHDLSLTVADGEHLAVMGPSGIGKSTLAGIMSGVTPPDRGTVALGGVPLHQMAPDELHRARVLLPQDAYVFAGTVRENLSYLAHDADDRVLLDAVRQLGLTDLLARLGGLDAQIDPARLSAGEKQQIALARAHAAPARLIILDEAASHLDPAAEARADEAFHRRQGTVITITHRVSSARRADRILLLDGTRAYLGTHTSLLTESPLYADLVGHWQADPGIPAPRRP